MKRLRLIAAAALAVLMLIFPGEALGAAIRALGVWAASFAPALFPFFVLVPVLTCEEALRFYEWCFGRVFGALFGCPGSAAAAVVVGWIAGSPAGSVAVSRVAMTGRVTRAHVKRMAMLSSCVSPMFLLSAVGVGLLASKAQGMILVRSQLISLVLSGLLFRRAFMKDDGPIPVAQARDQGAAHTMREAVLQMLTVCGWMVLFSVIGEMLAQWIGRPAYWAPLISILEVTGGCAAIAGLSLTAQVRLILLSAVCSFGGLAIMIQNMQNYRAFGVGYKQLLAGKAVHAALGAALTAAQLRWMPGALRPTFSAGQGLIANAWTAAGLLTIAVAIGVLLLRVTGSASVARRRRAGDAS